MGIAALNPSYACWFWGSGFEFHPLCAAEQRRAPRSGGKPGAISFGYFSWQDKKSD